MGGGGNGWRGPVSELGHDGAFDNIGKQVVLAGANQSISCDWRMELNKYFLFWQSFLLFSACPPPPAPLTSPIWQ